MAPRLLLLLATNVNATSGCRPSAEPSKHACGL